MSRLLRVCVIALVTVATVALVLPISSGAATRTVTVDYPNLVKYRFARGKAIHCRPADRIDLSCTSPQRVGPFSAVGQFYTYASSWNQKVGTSILGTNARAMTADLSTDATVRSDGFLKAIVQEIYKVLAGKESVETFVAGGGYADLFRNGDLVAAPMFANATEKGVKYTKSTDTMKVVDGPHRVMISGWSTAAPKVEVYDANDVLIFAS